MHEKQRENTSIVILAMPGELPAIVNVPTEPDGSIALITMQTMLGGYIELLYRTNFLELVLSTDTNTGIRSIDYWGDDAAAINGREPNRVVKLASADVIIRGPILVTACDEVLGNSVGLTLEEARRVLSSMSEWPMFVAPPSVIADGSDTDIIDAALRGRHLAERLGIVTGRGASQ